MKTNITLSIDIELAELLKQQDNYSSIVNDLIDNHFHETRDFKKLRIMNKLKLVKQQEKDFKAEKERVEAEVKAFLEKDKEVENERRREEKEREGEESSRDTRGKCGDTQGLKSGEDKESPKSDNE